MTAPPDAGARPVQRYRFRIRTADGRELVSSLLSVPLPSPIEAPRWSCSAAGPGEEVTLSAAAPGRDGQQARFLLERRDGSGWVDAGGGAAAVSSGRLELKLALPSLPPAEGAPAGAAHELRFRVQLEDGAEATSALLKLRPAPARAAALRAAHLGHHRYAAGDAAELAVLADGLEGKPVRFVLERAAGKAWVQAGEVRASVAGGKASATWPIPPARKGEPPGTYQLRFRALAGLASTTSEPAEVQVVAGKLKNPRWSGSDASVAAHFLHGDEVQMAVDAPGLDGRIVRFVVERFDGKAWTEVQRVTAVAAHGTAVGHLRAEHHQARPQRGSRPAALRFRPELVQAFGGA